MNWQVWSEETHVPFLGTNWCQQARRLIHHGLVEEQLLLSHTAAHCQLKALAFRCEQHNMNNKYINVMAFKEAGAAVEEGRVEGSKLARGSSILTMILLFCCRPFETILL